METAAIKSSWEEKVGKGLGVTECGGRGTQAVGTQGGSQG